MKNKKLIIAIIAIACAVIGCLIFVVACDGPKVTGVKSLVAANVKAQSKVDNYHMDGTVNMDIALDPEQSDLLEDILEHVNIELPVEMTVGTDAGSESAHITTDATVKLFGQSVPVKTAEVYLDIKNTVAYSRSGDSTKWKQTGDEETQLEFKDLAGGLAVVGKTVLDNATFKETEEYYSLIIPAEKAADLVAELNLLERVDLGIADVRDITVEGGQIVYNVDKTTRLVSSVELKDVDVRGKGVYKGVSADLLAPTNGTFRFSRYNELEDSEYAIPEEILKAGSGKTGKD